MLSDLDLRSRKVTKHPLPCTQKQSVGKLVKRREIYFRQVTVMPLEMDLIPLTEKISIAWAITEYMKMDLLGKVHNIQLDSVMIMYGLCKTTSN